MQFEWDEEKAAANLKKHEVSFAEAQTVFDDPLFLIFADPDHLLLWVKLSKINFSSFHLSNVRP